MDELSCSLENAHNGTMIKSANASCPHSSHPSWRGAATGVLSGGKAW
jgi:hypothetical protein